MIVYANKITPRLRYVTDFIGKEVIGKPFQLTSDKEFYKEYAGHKINYSNSTISNEELIINNYSLLFEDSIKEQTISCFEVKAFKAFFKTAGDYPFDIFAAAFYLLSRYEEYLPHQKDLYDRYAYENSLACKEGFLHLPLINIWLEDFKKVLKNKYPTFNIQPSTFNFQPTYDIDEAYAFREKNVFKTIGGLARSIMNGEWSMVKGRINVLSGKENDPYDSYYWMDMLHDRYNLKPLYFFHAGIKKGKYDKNIPPSAPAMQQLIKQHAEKYTIGIHPSWKSGDDESLLEKEIGLLESAIGKKITASRQHYIRFTLPTTFRRLINVGITDDYSMGYGSINGFRASVASSFYWYDLENEKQTNILLHPFCYMDANSFFEQKYRPQRAFEEMMHYYNAARTFNGTLITIWHNNFFGTHPAFGGWKEVYTEFVEAMSNK